MKAWDLGILGGLIMLTTITGESAAHTRSGTIQKATFGKTADGQSVDVYTCTNVTGASVKLITLGARLLEMNVPDVRGRVENVTLRLDNVAAYERHDAHFGGTVGRYANRIAKGSFILDGATYKLATNNGPNHLHGGIKGFDSVVWSAREVKNADSVGVEFKYHSRDGEEGYPGNVDVTVVYSFSKDNELKIAYAATTDKPTLINLTNHAYWNLGGVGSGDVLGHELMIAADKYLPIDVSSIPTGELKEVKGTAMDFTTPKTIGSRVGELKTDPKGTHGYDHCYALKHHDGTLALAARARHPQSGRVMEIWTTEPGVQLYVGNFLDGSAKNGGYAQHAAFCLETQHFPDSPHQPAFPSTVLRPGQTYRQLTVHRFSTDAGKPQISR